MDVVSIKSVYSNKPSHHVCIFDIDTLPPTKKRTLKKCVSYQQAIEFGKSHALIHKLLFLKSTHFKDEFGHLIPIPFINLLVDPIFF